MIIHIGFPKVLSTFLQKEVFNKIDANIISDEGLSGNVFNWRTGVLSRDAIIIGLSRLYPDAKIIVCIRRNKNLYVESLYSQYIKQGGFKSFNSWYSKDFDKRYLEYKSYIEKIKSLINDVHILYYEDFINNKKMEIQKLCDFIGIPLPENISYNKIYNKKWHGIRLKIGRVRGIIFKMTRILLELDKNA